jgi:hypothetical protein
MKMLFKNFFAGLSSLLLPQINKKMKAYKLTDASLQTFHNTQWALGAPLEASGKGNLCSGGWIHFYDDPKLAMIFNPIHASFEHPRLFEALAEGTIKEDRGIKFGCTKLTLIKEIEVPLVSLEVKVCFSILCSLIGNKDESYVKWANKWLNKEDRSIDRAEFQQQASSRRYYAADAAAHYATGRATGHYATGRFSTYIDYFAACAAAVRPDTLPLKELLLKAEQNEL